MFPTHLQQIRCNADLYDQDVCYVVSYDKSVWEQSTIKKLFEDIRHLNHIITISANPLRVLERDLLIRRYENTVHRLYSDQTVHDDRLNGTLKPKQIARKMDRITLMGMARLGDVFTGSSSARYITMVNGKGSTSAELIDWKMEDELVRSSILDNGYSSGSGTVIKHGAAFSINDESYTMYEAGATDFPSFNQDQTLWFRSVLNPGDQIQHEKGKDVIVISHAAFMMSVADFESEIAQGNV